jgi:hypothetical protein
VNEYDFQTQLAFSVDSGGRPFEQIISDTLPGVVTVVKTDVAVDKTGVDYIATLRGGSRINIDVKLRSKGCSKYWKNGAEELALETWSVMPEGCCKGKAGWTLDEAKDTHYTLHVFSGNDSGSAYLLPFQLLRKAFRVNAREWMNRFRVEIQSSGKWKSQCVFVPAFIVMDAISNASFVKQPAASKANQEALL